MNTKNKHGFTGLLSPMLLLPILLSTGLACGGTGMGQNVRRDVRNQMDTIKTPVASCYKDALHERSRRIGGTLVLRFKIEPKTGKFKKTEVARSELSDPVLEQCVVKAVNNLVLSSPQSATVGIDTYPIYFSPSN